MRESSSPAPILAISTSSSRTSPKPASAIGFSRNFSSPSTMASAKLDFGAIPARTRRARPAALVAQGSLYIPFLKLRPRKLSGGYDFMMRKTLAILLFSVATTAGAQSFQLHGFLTAREIYVNAQPSWLQGGAGRFDVGADTVNDHKLVNTDNAQVGFDWMPATWFLVHADGVARRQQSGTIGKRVGLIQGYAD